MLILTFVVLEIGLHSHYQIEGLAAEWNFPSRSNYAYQLTEIDKLVNFAETTTDSFYRTEKLDIQTGNDSMKYNYNGISQFSSIRNRSSSSTLDKLGFRSDGTNLNLRYQNNTIIADSLFAVKYNLAESDPLKYGFSLQKTENSLSLYENQEASQLAILTEGLYKDVKFTNLTLDNQSNFLNQLTGLDQKYYSSIEPTGIENAEELGNRITAKTPENGEMATVHYHLTIPSSTQLYLNLPNLTFTNSDQKMVQVTVNNVSNTFTLDNTFAIFNVGYFEEAQDIQVTISFPYNSQVSFDKPTFYRLDTESYQKAMDILNSKTVQVTAHGNVVKAHFDSQKEASLFFTLPYDKGWSATLNGQPVQIDRAQEGFMKVDVPAGQGRVVLTFVPQGFWTGFFFSIAGVVLFLLYCLFKQKRKLSISQSEYT